MLTNSNSILCVCKLKDGTMNQSLRKKAGGVKHEQTLEYKPD